MVGGSPCEVNSAILPLSHPLMLSKSSMAELGFLHSASSPAVVEGLAGECGNQPWQQKCGRRQQLNSTGSRENRVLELWTESGAILPAPCLPSSPQKGLGRGERERMASGSGGRERTRKKPRGEVMDANKVCPSP